MAIIIVVGIVGFMLIVILLPDKKIKRGGSSARGIKESKTPGTAPERKELSMSDEKGDRKLYGRIYLNVE